MLTTIGDKEGATLLSRLNISVSGWESTVAAHLYHRSLTRAKFALPRPNRPGVITILTRVDPPNRLAGLAR